MTISNRIEFAYLFDVKNGNPNGDPDADNQPRSELDSGHGLVSDVCLKRKVRNFVDLTHGNTSPHSIYVRDGAVLSVAHDAALGVVEGEGKGKAKGKVATVSVDDARAAMCRDYYDIRLFGAVLANKGSANDAVRGPVQLTFSRSIEPIVAQRHVITRCAATNAEEGKANKTMGHKWTVPYGLYRCHGFVSAAYADRTGASDADLDLLWDALANMFDHDRSAARGEMAAQALVLIRHDNKLGRAPAHKLLDRIKVARVGDAAYPARAFEDYALSIDTVGLPQGVEIERKF